MKTLQFLLNGDKIKSDMIYKYPNGRFVYLASPDSEEITVTPVNTLFNDPALWTFTDNSGKLYTPKKVIPYNQGTITLKENKGPLAEAVNNYLGELLYDINNGVPVSGKYTIPAIAATALLPLAGEAAAPALAGNPYVNAALASIFAGHGLNHIINEGINGYGDAAMTALEIAPLGRLVKPIYKGVVQPGMRLFNSPLTGNWTKIGNREYRLSPNSFGASGIPIESRKVGDQEIQNLIPRYNKFAKYYGYNAIPKGTSAQEAEKIIKETLKQHNTFYRGLTYPEGEKLEAVKKVLGEDASREDVMNYLARAGSRDPNNTYFSLDERANQYTKTGDVARYTRKYTLGDNPSTWLEDADFTFDTTPATLMAPKGSINYPWAGSYIKEVPGEVRINPEDVIFEGWMPKTKWGYGEYVKPSEYKANRNLYFNKNAGGIKPSFRAIPETLQITEKNAANIAPEQWTAAQDAAIARGDMAEAQRLRDLHFETIGSPVRTQEGSMRLTHATKNKFNSFDLSKAGTGSGNTTNTEGVIHLSPYDDAALDVFKPKTIKERNAYNLMHLYANNPNPVEVPLETFIKSWNDKEAFKVLRDAGDGIIARGKSPYKLYAERLAEYERKKDAGKLMPWTRKPESPKDFMEEAVVDGYTINNPKNLKLADAVTYDDNGVRIPLGKRDNFKSNDIRYSWLPWFLGGTSATTLYNINK